ncbi:MAG TPA: hypothetical protein VFO73_12150 [Candidatus Limnocylindrales bacterium]|nr:hypothetical protein [Candidatus Limnocylindrales bacterium]
MIAATAIAVVLLVPAAVVFVGLTLAAATLAAIAEESLVADSRGRLIP